MHGISDLLGQWLPVAYADALVSQPLRIEVCGTGIVLWRAGSGVIGAVRDRCIHRGARLSLGKVQNGCIQCPYHGWAFDIAGICVHQPLADPASVPGTKVPSFRCIENNGLLWICKRDSGEFPLGTLLNTDLHIRYRFEDDIKANALDVVENLLDVTHFPFVHQSTFGSEDALTDPASVRYEHTDFGFDCLYEVPVQTRGHLHLVTGTARSVRVVAQYIAPVTQIFHVRYDNGIQYSSLQTVCPVSDQQSKFYQFAFSVHATDPFEDESLLSADREIWLEDKRVLESLDPVDAECDPEEARRTAGPSELHRFHLLAALQRMRQRPQHE
jgi:phenylpropionate dioxygenase-like ring-hydroxylating dioxygenase large terminal subunit